MGTVKTTILVTAVLAISACTTTFNADLEVNDNNPMDYTIEQNELGEYVFCKDGGCSSWERKELAEVQPIPEDAVRVFFNLGSSKLGAGAENTLLNVLPRLKNTNAVYLRGWADSIGGRNTKINRRLSQQRAETIKNWLIGHGVIAHIQTASQPACCNNDDTRTVVITW